MTDHQGWLGRGLGGCGTQSSREAHVPAPTCTPNCCDLTSHLLSQGAMAATYSALNSSKPTPQLKPIESSILAQRRVRKLPSTTL